MTYKEQLEATKEYYPFERWKELFYPDKDEPDYEGMEQYAPENCDAAAAIFNTLIDALNQLGPDAPEEAKVALFEKAVLSLNTMNDEIDGFIETGEREELCELIDHIGIAAGLKPEEYGDGEGLATEWREW